MSLKLDDTAPNFRAATTQGPIDFHEWIGASWVVLLSHPGDFTPVCTTELGRAGTLAPEFTKRNAKLIAISVDTLESHFAWLKHIEATQNTSIQFPIIADPDREVAYLYDMIHPNADDSATARTLFVVNPEKKIKLTLAYPASTGRNFDEVLRILDSLQLTRNYQVATPVDWVPGGDCVILPNIKTEELQLKFPKGYTEITSYLRTTPQPDR